MHVCIANYATYACMTEYNKASTFAANCDNMTRHCYNIIIMYKVSPVR